MPYQETSSSQLVPWPDKIWTNDTLDKFKITFEKRGVETLDVTLTPKADSFLRDNIEADESAVKDIWRTNFMKAARTFLFNQSPMPLLHRFLMEMMSDNLIQLVTAPKEGRAPEWPSVDITVVLVPIMKNSKMEYSPVEGGVMIAQTCKDTEQCMSLEGSDALEIELVMGGIALCMDKNWPQNCPIFMVKSIGSRVTVYEAVFSRNLLEKVQRGEAATEPTTVYKYCHSSFPGGFDMMVPEQREVLVRTICYAQSRIIRDFSWEGDEFPCN